MDLKLFFGIIVGFAVLIFILDSYIKIRDAIRLANSNMSEVDKMSGRDFEKFLGTIFKRLNYKVEVTKASGDFGADLILWKDKKKIIVQAKRYKNKVPIKAIQEIVGAKAFYNADEIWVITNSHFTDPAVKLANANGVKLIERNQLANIILESRQEKINT